MLIFIFAGLIKGVVGMGLPTISLALLAIFLDLSTAISLIIIPSFFTNIWQAINGNYLKNLMREFWLFFLLSGFSVFIGTYLFFQINNNLTLSLLGVLIIIYGFFSFKGRMFKIKEASHFLMKPIIALLNGILTGLTGSLIVPGVFYFQLLNLGKQKFIQALGIHFSILTLCLGISTITLTSFDDEIFFLSLASCISAIIGMLFGGLILRSIDEQKFKKIFLYMLIVIGTLIIFKSIVIV